MPETEKIETGSIGNIPMQVREKIIRDIGNFAVAIFGISQNEDGETLTFCGSGSLVSAVESYYVLTAAHVWTKLKAFEQVALTLKERQSHSFRMDRQAIIDVSLGPGEPQEWGPDLCFLRRYDQGVSQFL